MTENHAAVSAPATCPPWRVAGEPRNELPAETTTPIQPISNRSSKLLEISLTHAESITSIFLIDNFQRLHPEVVAPERSRRGGERIITNTCSQNYKFEGKERDTESNLDNFGARYNSSSLGRFMIADWAAKPTSVPYAQFGDPQSLNLYVYVGNNPLLKTDRDGHDWWDAIKKLVDAIHVKISLGVGAANKQVALGTGTKAAAELKYSADINTQNGIQLSRTLEASAKGSVGGFSAGPTLSDNQVIATLHPDSTVTGEEKPTTEISIMGDNGGTEAGTSTSGSFTLAGAEDNLAVPMDIGGVPFLIPTPFTAGGELNIDIGELWKLLPALLGDGPRESSPSAPTTTTPSTLSPS